jgi:hypothetical protein
MLLSTAVFLVALASISIEAYKTCKDPKLMETKAKNYKFTIAMVVLGVLSILISFAGIVGGVRSGSI